MIPKFRAWDKLRKRMSTVDRIYFDTEGVQLRDDGGLYWRHFREVILMQSTGLKDKNGKEIFEGDVVKQEMLIPTSEIEEITGVVKMLEGAWIIANDEEEIACHLWREGAKMKILGNIYEKSRADGGRCMTLKDRVENLEALHTVQKRSLANTQLWLVFVSFIMLFMVIGMIAGYSKQQTQIKDLQTELERVTDEQKHVNQRQDVMINKFNQMYYEYQHKKITGKDNFPGG